VAGGVLDEIECVVAAIGGEGIIIDAHYLTAGVFGGVSAVAAMLRVCVCFLLVTSDKPVLLDFVDLWKSVGV
jgi:hypothetical protein